MVKIKVNSPVGFRTWSFKSYALRSLPVLINICQDPCNEEVLLTCSCDLGWVVFCNLLHHGHSGQVDGILQAMPLDINCPECSGQLHSECVAEIKQSTLSTIYGCMQVQYYFRLCSIPDYDGKLQYDGQTECVLNMGRSLVHYDVLRDFMFQFLYSRCTMYAYQIMKSMESPNIPFTLLKTRFEVASEAVI